MANHIGRKGRKEQVKGVFKEFLSEAKAAFSKRFAIRAGVEIQRATAMMKTKTR